MPTFNDDIESTAAAVVAAVLGGVRLQNVPPLVEQRFVFVGAGQANVGTARLLTRALVAEGTLKTRTLLAVPGQMHWNCIKTKGRISIFNITWQCT